MHFVTTARLTPRFGSRALICSSALLTAVMSLAPIPAHAAPQAAFFCHIDNGNMPLDPVTGGRFRESGGVGSPCGDSFDFTPVSGNGPANALVTARAEPGSDTTPPVANSEASMQNFSAGSGSAQANLAYAVQMTWRQGINPINNFFGVPVNVQAVGLATAFIFGGAGSANIGDGYAIAKSELTVSGGTLGGHWESNACVYQAPYVVAGLDRCPLQVDIFLAVLTGTLRISDQITFTLRTQAQADGAFNPSTGAGITFTGHATVDPYVWIDPTYMIEYEGQMVPADQLLTLVASPGIDFVNIPAPDPVPLPPTVWQLGIGLLAVAARAVRRRPYVGAEAPPTIR